MCSFGFGARKEKYVGRYTEHAKWKTMPKIIIQPYLLALIVENYFILDLIEKKDTSNIFTIS